MVGMNKLLRVDEPTGAGPSGQYGQCTLYRDAVDDDGSDLCTTSRQEAFWILSHRIYLRKEATTKMFFSAFIISQCTKIPIANFDNKHLHAAQLYGYTQEQIGRPADNFDF